MAWCFKYGWAVMTMFRAKERKMKVPSLNGGLARRTLSHLLGGLAAKLFFVTVAICALNAGPVAAANAASANRNREATFVESAKVEGAYDRLASRFAADLFRQALLETEACSFPDLVEASVRLSQTELAATARVASLDTCSNQSSGCGRALIFFLLLGNSGSRTR
jgi:hypothetical protein